MPKPSAISAGLLLYRRPGGRLQVLLAHPGGPFWSGRDAGAWTIPKGLVRSGEALLAAACREFEEETGLHPSGPFLSLGSIQQKAGKLIHAWAFEGDAETAELKSNLMRAQWPYGSGRWLTFPEVDRFAWYRPRTARMKLNPAQAAFVARLEAAIRPKAPE